MLEALPLDMHSGWAFLLPALPTGTRVLLVEAGPRRADLYGDHWPWQLSTVQVQPAALELPHAMSSFDGVICRLSGSGLSSVAQAKLLAECARVLVDRGWLYADVDATGLFSRIFCRGSIVRTLHRLGLLHQRTWVLLLERGMVSEVLPKSGYRSFRNSWRWTEVLKQWLYGPLARWLGPAHAVLASRYPLNKSMIEQLVPGASPTDFVRLVLTPGKSFFQKNPGTEPVSLIHLLPVDRHSVERRRTEFGIISQLRSMAIDMSRLLPSISEERTVNGQPMFVLEAFDGVTIDLPVSEMDALYFSANDVLLRFNAQSARIERFDETGLSALLSCAGREAMERYSQAAPALSELLVEMERLLVGSSCQVVWLHGDYKLENLVFDRHNRSVQAVIDWELASSSGFPFMDLLYLLIYRQITLGRAHDVLEVLEDLPVLWSDHLAAGFRERYITQFGLSEEQQKLAIAMFFVHHIAVRYLYKKEDREAMQRMIRLADFMAAGLRSIAGGERP